jgi:hypothetical protein
VNQWLFRYWQLCKGDFSPINPQKDRKYYEINMNINEICSSIRKQKYKEIILNDAECDNFEERMSKIVSAFDAILPEKSGFEK